MIVRRALPADAPAMTALQNLIIREGGTTAYEDEREEADILARYIAPVDGICCHVAELGGRVIGFQVVSPNPVLPAGWAEIGTFVASDVQARGIGQALFAATGAAARAAGVAVLNATIRADNRPGLAYYARLGFVDYSADPGWALKSGAVVGRVSRRLDL